MDFPSVKAKLYNNAKKV